MNLGKRRITNDELAAALERLGFDQPMPYQASGNVILPEATSVDSREVERGLETELGYPVPVFARTDDEVRQLAESPLKGLKGADGGKPQIVFMHEETMADLTSVFRPDDRIEVRGREIHWLPPGGLAETAGLLKAVDDAVGGTTIRTLGTIERIARKLT